MNKCLPCPFCAKEIDITDGDTLYPNGTGWKNHTEDNLRSYHHYREVPREQWRYSLHCAESSGGCGAQISGDTQQDAIDKWNRRS